MHQLLKSAATLIFATAFAAGVQAADAPMEIAGTQTVDAEGVITLIESTPNLVILDNRSEADYGAGHIEGAVRLIDTDINSPEDISAHVSGKEVPVLFYCNGLRCGRAAKAATKAVDYGYDKVFYYALGMEEWREKGLPLVTQ